MIEIYDTTLRDGAQQEGISFSVDDKLKIAKKLSELGIHFIEGGWPGSNPKDTEFFRKAQDLALSQTILCAFGSTRKANITAEADPGLPFLLEAETEVITLVGKSHDLQVSRVLETSLEENLTMIAESIGFLKSKGRRVFFDAEHFFDGYKSNPDYALRVLSAAADAGAERLILCDTNGGSLPSEIATAVEAVRRRVTTPLGIHAHNDAELAVANTLAAVEAGAVQVQGTINGYGERCGNANLSSIIPDLKLKMGIDCLSWEQLSRLSEVSRYVSELANLSLAPHQPYIGTSAFAHKGGLHASGISKWEESYHHIDPGLVGNWKRLLVSELSGASNIIYKAREAGLDIPRGEEARSILEQIKLLENQGFQYEDAEASFELLVHRSQPDYHPPFQLVDFMVVVERRRRPSVRDEEILAEATVKVKVGNEVIHTAAEGNGPVNALDSALRKALVQFYPQLAQVKLSDYKVRILNESAGTESLVRVLIESTDGAQEWRTVGSSTNIIEASWLALADSLEYWLVRNYDN
jgi:2-isopropylmalate synthase